MLRTRRNRLGCSGLAVGQLQKLLAPACCETFKRVGWTREAGTRARESSTQHEEECEQAERGDAFRR